MLRARVAAIHLAYLLPHARSIGIRVPPTAARWRVLRDFTSMNDVVRWGIVGTGSVAQLFAADLRFVRGAQLAAVGSRDAARARAFADSFGASRAHASYDAVINDSNVDVLYIATLNTLHRQHAIAGLEAGKAVLCEKPFTLNASEARDVVQVARRSGRFCMEAMWMRFAPAVRELQARIKQGEIGEVRQINASLGFHFSFNPVHRVFDPHVGGGTLLDLGVYPISLCDAILGAPTGVTSQATIGVSDVDEHATMTLTYANGATASIETSLRSFLPNDAVIVGTRGRLSVPAPLYFPRAVASSSSARAPEDRSTQPQRLLRTLTGIARIGAAKLQAPIQGSGYQYQVQEVMRCLAEGRSESELMSLDDTVRVMETMDAVRAAWAT